MTFGSINTFRTITCGIIDRDKAAPPTYATNYNFYGLIATVHQQCVALIEAILHNACVLASLKYEEFTNLPQLTSLEDP